MRFLRVALKLKIKELLSNRSYIVTDTLAAFNWKYRGTGCEMDGGHEFEGWTLF